MTNLKNLTDTASLPVPANMDAADPPPSTDQKIISWLFRATAQSRSALGLQPDLSTLDRGRRYLARRMAEPSDDWDMVTTLCGHPAGDFYEAVLDLPLSSAEIDHFRRNHRGTDSLISRDFLTTKSELPSPLAELYGLYRHRARLDVEAALFVAQATHSTRIARVMADLLAIGAFANGHECVSHLTKTYAIPAAFDTSDLIDHANDEAARRLALPIEHPAHLLKLSPDEISVLASNMVEKNILGETDFLEKAERLAEARQDVGRMPSKMRFATALREGDLPLEQLWVTRLALAYSRVFAGWGMDNMGMQQQERAHN